MKNRKFIANEKPCNVLCNFAVDCAVTPFPFPKISADKLDKMRVRDGGGGVVQSAVESHFALVLSAGRPGESRPLVLHESKYKGI